MQCLSKHVNIVNLREAYVTRSEVVIVMDCMEGGSLTDTLGPGVDFRETHIAYVCKQMLMALAFMHSQFRLHRDIKSDNVLVSSSLCCLPWCVIIFIVCERIECRKVRMRERTTHTLQPAYIAHCMMIVEASRAHVYAVVMFSVASMLSLLVRHCTHCTRSMLTS
jgi:serine/threonine protein kinase